MYDDRTDAGQQLAKLLVKHKKAKNTLILAIPRGGLEIGHELAKHLSLPLSVVIVKKLGHPRNEEYAIGAVGKDDEYLNEEIIRKEGIGRDYLKSEIKRLREEVNKRYERYVKGKPPALKGKTIILCDDGLATGITMLLSLRIIKKQKPARIIVAVPVAPEAVLEMLRKEADEVVCPLPIAPTLFFAIGSHYLSFPQLEDEDAIALLKEAND
jgi:predicted phosphoribosyltransferase